MAAGFSFNFEISQPDSQSSHDGEENKYTSNESTFVCIKPERISMAVDELNQILVRDTLPTQCITLGDKRLLYLSVKFAESLIHDLYSSSATDQALKHNTDLVTSLYEGGLKIWECSIDLVRFLSENCAKNGLQGRKVLELGCGAGLPGIFCLTNGATVHFQDYNPEVLKLFTIPNVIMNVSGKINFQATPLTQKLLETVNNTCAFHSGDWDSVSSLLQPSWYDVIVTSETIYNPSTQRSLYELMKYSLKPGGVVFIAAKSYYFGVGGGTQQFIDHVQNDGVFIVDTVQTFSGGVKREILRMEYTK